MADKNWQAGGKILIPAQAVVCLIATAAPFGTAWGASDRFAPASYVGSADPRQIWGFLSGGARCQPLSRGGRAVDPFGLAQGQALAAAPECLCQLGPEQPQPRRGDDGSAE